MARVLIVGYCVLFAFGLAVGFFITGINFIIYGSSNSCTADLCCGCRIALYQNLVCQPGSVTCTTGAVHSVSCADIFIKMEFIPVSLLVGVVFVSCAHGSDPEVFAVGAMHSKCGVTFESLMIKFK